ncbi:6-bladed beta-propeller [Bacteroides sp. An51A]|uniref:6-bladed beta-propeller n=2 Tax=unclassified Bacteroides TaxID=2646097 RepID=UPI000B3A8997|nr:6-bladed beta-propeller [Bacteroides sp. An51A]OUN80033.1 hypothetical protein B5G04_10825 [Bacteroides sp. An51A]OUP26697.1 hypothetical protein B5F25_20080 [Bacteroides sp. An19]
MKWMGLVLVLLLGSCTSRFESDRDTYAIDYREDSVFDWNSLVQVEEAIPLETTDSLLLSYARKCIVTSNYIVYHDDKQKSIFVFNSHGAFLYQIDALGGGEGEYTVIKDMTLSYDKKSLLILDNASVLAYDMETGRYQYRLTFEDSMASDFYQFVNPTKDCFYFWSAGQDYSLYVYTDNRMVGIKKREGFPFVTQKFFYDSEGEVNCLSDYGHFRIDRLVGDELQKKYAFDFGKWTLPSSLIPQTATELSSVDSKPYFKCLLSTYETGSHLFISTVSPDLSLYNICIDKRMKRIYSGKQDQDSPLVVVNASDESFYGILYPFFFQEKGMLHDLIRRCGRLEDDNPLLIRFSFKSFDKE